MSLVACSSSSGDGIEPDPATASATWTSTGGQDTGTGGGGGSSDQNRVSLVAWQGLQGEFDTLDQAPVNEDGPTPPERQRMVGCPFVAPDLGERVVYVERSAIEGDSGPNRQMLIAFTARPADEASPHAPPRAVGTIHQLTEPEKWTGQCQPGIELSLLSEVISVDECTLDLHVDEAGVVHAMGSSVDARCVATSLEVERVSTAIIIDADALTWHDDDGEGNWQDPPPDPASGDTRRYEFKRRTPWPEESP